MPDYSYNPGAYQLTDDSGEPTSEGRSLMAELASMVSQREGDFGQLYALQDKHERLWALHADRLRLNAEELEKVLPNVAHNGPRTLTDRLIRATTRNPVTFRIDLSSRWSSDERTQAEDLETYLDAIIALADEERLHAGLGPVQTTLAWNLVVRGAGVAIGFTRSSARGAGGTPEGEHFPFKIITPDPRQCVWDLGGVGPISFAHHYWRRLSDIRRMYPHAAEYQAGTGLAETINAWWLDGGGNVWNATQCGGCWLVEPTNHTKLRGLTRLPVYVDSAFGAPFDVAIGGGQTESLEWQYLSALASNEQAYLAQNAIDAHRFRLLQIAVFSAMALFTTKQFSQQDMIDFYTGKAVMKLNPEDKAPAFVQPPQLSPSVERLDQMITAQKQQGGLPDSVGSSVPEGASGLYASEIQLQGDTKAGPVSEALQRILKGCVISMMTQHQKLRRNVNVLTRRGDTLYDRTVKAADLPPVGAYRVETRHKVFLVEDRFRQAQTMQALKMAGLPDLSIFEEFTLNPIEQLRRRDEDVLDTNPIVAALRQAQAARQKYPEDPRVSEVFLRIAGGMIQQQLGTGQPQGQTNAPRAPMPPDAAPMPESNPIMAPAPESMGPVDPTNPAQQQMLGALGGAYGGER